MDDFSLWKPVHSDNEIRLKVLESPEQQGNMLVKQYLCSSCEEGDCLLKEALAQVTIPYPLWMVLRKVVLCGDGRNDHIFTVNYVYEKLLRDSVPRKIIEKNDRIERAPNIRDYTLKELMYENDNIPVRIYKASNLEGKTVVIKLLEGTTKAKDCNEVLKEAFIQASICHKNSTPILDIGMIIWAKGRFKIALVLEEFHQDLRKDIKERKGKRYEEEELVSFLYQISSVLRYAKRKGIAHRDIKPENIFVTKERVFKLGDFGSAWTANKPIKYIGNRVVGCSAKQLLEQYAAQEAGGTLLYLSPEMRDAMIGIRASVDSFASDIYSLGVTTLEMATLENQTSLNTVDSILIKEAVLQTIESLEYSNNFTTLLRKMLEVEYDQRPNVFDIYELELFTDKRRKEISANKFYEIKEKDEVKLLKKIDILDSKMNDQFKKQCEMSSAKLKKR